MPKKARGSKRLTQRKGTDINGRRTNCSKTNFAQSSLSSSDSVPVAAKIPRTIEDSQNVTHENADLPFLDPSYLLEGEHINAFLEVLNRNSFATALSTLVIAYPELFLGQIQPIMREERDIQIFGGIADYAHWHCLYHFNSKLYIYDSRNNSTQIFENLNETEKRFINIRYPHIAPSDVIFKNCQQQPDNFSCGLFAIAFATAIALGEDPSIKTFHLDRESNIVTSTTMRRHLQYMINNNALLGFPEEVINQQRINQFENNEPQPLNRLNNNILQPEHQLNTLLPQLETFSIPQNSIPIIHSTPSYLKASSRQTEPLYLGRMNLECNLCNALHFRCERNTIGTGNYTKCCKRGKIDNTILPPLQPFPEYLKNLFKGETGHRAHFKKYVLQYNYIFQFVSIEAQLRRFDNPGPYAYSVQGKIYHHLSNINVQDPAPRYSGIYFMDANHATIRRLECNGDQALKIEIVAEIENLMRQENPYAQIYQFLKETYINEPNNDENISELVLELLAVRGDRRYNLPVSNEVAAVYKINEFLPPTPNIRVFLRNQPDRFTTLDYHSPIVDPLTFPLLFPNGEHGWNMYMRQTEGTHKVTLLQYYAYRLAYRAETTEHFPRFLYGGRLTQQYLVASFIKVEANRIDYIRNNQRKLRAELYEGLSDYLEQYRARNQAERIGKMVILPSTYIGSPRSQLERFQDSLALVSKFGMPSLFITMTCNAKWKEVVENIPQHCEPDDQPLLVCRVFHAKMHKLREEIYKDNIFGISIGGIDVEEFQKRGKPHSHMLITLRDEDKLSNNCERINELISAEIPNKTTEPLLYDLVLQHMIHGPCGDINPNSPCMENGKCTKKYPMPFSEETFISNNGRVTYKRPDNGRYVTITRNNEVHYLDNRWVVPYNAYTLLKYQCHINIEACVSVSSVKYIHKYLFKGVDKALIHITQDNAVNYDETESYLSGRYLSHMESAWHLLEMETHNMTHAIYRLPVHLPLQQTVYFEEGEEIEALERSRTTKLTAWMELNVTDIDARQYLYTEIPLHYVWHVQGNTKRWKKRQRGGDKVICRMYNIHMPNSEVFYLRLLLLHVRGCTSYEDIRTFEGITYDTFLQACEQRGLLSNDATWTNCLQEAVLLKMPRQMRKLFAYILIFGNVANPPNLWENFREHLMHDFTRKNISPEEAEQKTLRQLQTVMLLNGRRLCEFNLPEPEEIVNVEEEPLDINLERNEGIELRQQLNAEQLIVYDQILAAVADDNLIPRLFFLKGSGGTGKTFLYNTILSVLNGRNIKSIVVAWSGLASGLLKNGRTVHSRFRFQVPIIETTTSAIRSNTDQGQLIIQSKLLLWDEISMVPLDAFHAVDRTLRDLCRINKPFGGKVVIIGGDFKQTLPILLNAYRSQIVDNCIKSSHLWNLFTTLELRTNVRAGPDELRFAQWLEQVGNNTLPPISIGDINNLVEIPPQCVIDSIETLITKCFEDINSNSAPNTAILTPTNKDCNEINDMVISKLNGETKVFYSSDSIAYEGDEVANAHYSTEFLNCLEPSGLPPHKLSLKVGAVIILLRNINRKDKLFNGTRLIITSLGERIIQCRRIHTDGSIENETHILSPMKMTPINTTLPFKLVRIQFPIKVAYCMTISKSQGLTFSKVGVYLPNPVFGHGMLYVSFSRTKSFNSLFVYIKDTTSQGKLIPGSNRTFTKNVIFSEVI